MNRGREEEKDKARVARQDVAYDMKLSGYGFRTTISCVIILSMNLKTGITLSHVDASGHRRQMRSQTRQCVPSLKGICDSFQSLIFFHLVHAGVGFQGLPFSLG